MESVFKLLTLFKISYKHTIWSRLWHRLVYNIDLSVLNKKFFLYFTFVLLQFLATHKQILTLPPNFNYHDFTNLIHLLSILAYIPLSFSLVDIIPEVFLFLFDTPLYCNVIYLCLTRTHNFYFTTVLTTWSLLFLIFISISSDIQCLLFWASLDSFMSFILSFPFSSSQFIPSYNYFSMM